LGSTNDIVKNFLNELAANNRLSVLASVSEKFAQLMSAHRGEVELIVTSAAVSQYWG
jgi:F-type H+-transporting ATPase subunit O